MEGLTGKVGKCSGGIKWHVYLSLRKVNVIKGASAIYGACAFFSLYTKSVPYWSTVNLFYP